MKEVTYDASGGTEHFISLEIAEMDALVGYARLRTGDGLVASLRELKVFGRMTPISHRGDGWQHRGHGKDLLARAEEIAQEEGCGSIRVTSGVGVRNYYAALGYERSEVYMLKRLL